ncbi:glycosyltransferase family 39 protein [Streptomyces sp. NPDC006529]|uniref:glycosyltransferase family 39 protein n=1 Tax=Streptomyces sp. NPDC006529 TaxID=3157177 RepID=UPI0033A086EB
MWASWRRAQGALLVHIALRLVGVGVVAAWGQRKGIGLHEILATRWDSVYYLNIADHGYSSAMVPACHIGGPTCKLAFFPVYPLLTRGLSAVTGVPADWAGWAISLVASVLAAWGIFAVAEKLHSARVAFFAVALYAVVPHALVLSMAYTEPVFIALSAWAVYAVLTRRWLTAGVLALLVGATRPSGAAVVAAVVLCALWALFTGRKRHGVRRPSARLCTTVLLAPLGWFAFFAWVGHRMSRWDGYFVEQSQWGSTFDGGVYTAQRLRELVTQPGLTLNQVVVSTTVVTALVLLVLLSRQRPPAVVWIYTAVLVLIAAGGAGFFHSKARFLLPAFPLLFPFAVALARARTATVYWILGTATAASALYSGPHPRLEPVSLRRRNAQRSVPRQGKRLRPPPSDGAAAVAVVG